MRDSQSDVISVPKMARTVARKKQFPSLSLPSTQTISSKSEITYLPEATCTLLYKIDKMSLNDRRTLNINSSVFDPSRVAFSSEA